MMEDRTVDVMAAGRQKKTNMWHENVLSYGRLHSPARVVSVFFKLPIFQNCFCQHLLLLNLEMFLSKK